MTVNSGFNVTGTTGSGIVTSAVNGLNAVNVTAGTVQASGNGINATSSEPAGSPST